MKAMVLNRAAPIEDKPLNLQQLPTPQPDSNQVRVRVTACGVCHTELDEIEGRLPPKLPIIPGHEIVGVVDDLGSNVTKLKVGDRVGIGWINSACGSCRFCKEDTENLCPDFRGTGCDADGGYAEFTVIHENFAYPIPQRFSDEQAAPLLCAGAIGYRALKLSNLQ